MNSTAIPASSTSFLTAFAVSSTSLPDFESMSGTTSSSWNITASKPAALNCSTFQARSFAGRVSGPYGSRPSLMFQGPIEKRYVVSASGMSG